MSKQETVQLAPGMQAVVTCDGLVAVALGVGSIDVDGTGLVPEQTYRFRLCARSRQLALYTATGGSFVLKATASYRVQQHPTRVPSLTQVFRGHSSRRPMSRLLIVGDQGAGKSAAARLALSSLLKAHTGDSDSTIVFLEGDPARGSVCACGTVSVTEARPPALPIESPFLESIPVSFFPGFTATPPSGDGLLLHTLSQATETADWWLRRGEHRSRHLVVDAPNPAPGTDRRWFTKQLLEVVRPTHVVALTAPDSDSYSWLAEDVHRALDAGCTASILPPLTNLDDSPKAADDDPDDATWRTDSAAAATTTRSATSSKAEEQTLVEYFTGSLSTPMECAAVVASIRQLKFVQHAPEVGASAIIPATVAALKPGQVVASSHAHVVEEAAYANIAGLLVVKSIDVEGDEIAFYAPDTEAIPQNIIIVGSPSLRCRPDLLAPRSI